MTVNTHTVTMFLISQEDMVVAVTAVTEADAEVAEEDTVADVVEEEEDTEMAGK